MHMGIDAGGVLAVPEAISTLPSFLPSLRLPFPSCRELRLTTVNVETSVAMAENDAAAKGDLKVVCEGVTRNLGLRDVGRVRARGCVQS